jgi:hypothetical protein
MAGVPAALTEARALRTAAPEPAAAAEAEAPASAPEVAAESDPTAQLGLF